MKKVAPVLLATSLLAGISYTGMPAHATTDPQSLVIYVEDKEMTFDPAPQLIQDRVFVPLRSLANTLGADVQYDSKTDTATIQKGDLVITLNFATGAVQKNGAAMTVDPAPRFLNDRTMVPIRFLSEAFGNEVTYDGATQTIRVLPTQKTLEQRNQMKRILQQSQAVMDAKSSYAMDVNVKFVGTYSDGALSTLGGKIRMSYTKNPLAIHEKGTFTGADHDRQETHDFETFLSKDHLYMMDSSPEKWIEVTGFVDSPFSPYTNMLSFSSTTVQTEEQLAKLLPYATLREDSEMYQISYNFDSIGIGKLLALQPTTFTWGKNQLKRVKLSIDIDKATYQQKVASMQWEITDKDVDGFVEFTENFRDFDNVPPIVLPDEVLNSKDHI